MNKIILVVSACILCSLASCASSSKVKGRGGLYDCSGKLAVAIEKFRKKKYSSAQEMLTEILSKCPGHESNDTTLYYLGKSWIALKRPDDAKIEFDHLVQTFSNSPFVEEARFLVGFASYLASSPWYLDQTPTLEARNRLRGFLESNPGSPYADSARLYIAKCNDKLAEKEFQTARFYEKISKFEASIVYHKNVINEFPESPFAPLSKLSVAEDLIELSRNTEAIAVLDELRTETKDEAILKKTEALKQKAAKSQQ
jgi:outer membrane protein assembly factor BamD